MNFGFCIKDILFLIWSFSLIFFSNSQSTHNLGSPEPTITNPSDSETGSLIPSPPSPLPEPKPSAKFNESSQTKQFFQVTESNKTVSLQQLPDATSSWQDIREKNFIYVDKTAILEHFLDTSSVSFFSRPRGFGKTVLLQTIKSFFKGEKHLFVNTTIYSRGNTKDKNGTWIEYPVIHVDMSKISIFNQSISNATSLSNLFHTELNTLLKQIGKDYGLNDTSSYFYFGELIDELNYKFQQPVVVLIDEYDIVVQQAISLNKSINIVKSIAYDFDEFCGTITAHRELIKFAWLTGDTKLVTCIDECLMYDFNDLTFEEEFSTAAGFTVDEIKKYFYSHLQNFPPIGGKIPEPDEVINELVEWYDGYSFVDPEENQVRVLNPTSVIQSLKNKLFEDYWCETGLTTLFDWLCYWGFAPSEIDDFRTTKSSVMGEFEHNSQVLMPFEVGVFHMGYATMDEYDDEFDSVVLRIPNKEVKQCLEGSEDRWIRYVPSLKQDILNLPQLTNDFQKKINSNDIPGMFQILTQFGFVPFFNPPRNTTEEHAIARLSTLFKYSDVAYTQNKKFSEEKDKTAGDFDILTDNLPVNFAIKIKYLEPIEKTVDRLIGYVKNHFERFRETIEHPKINLLIVNFTSGRFLQTKSYYCEAWANLLLERNQLRFEGMSASSDVLKKALEEQHFNISKIIELPI